MKSCARNCAADKVGSANTAKLLYSSGVPVSKITTAHAIGGGPAANSNATIPRVTLLTFLLSNFPATPVARHTNGVNTFRDITLKPCNWSAPSSEKG